MYPEQRGKIIILITKKAFGSYLNHSAVLFPLFGKKNDFVGEEPELHIVVGKFVIRVL